MAFSPAPGLRGVLIGSGSDGMGHQQACDAIVKLRSPDLPKHVVYIGAATYDLEAPKERQTAALIGAGFTSEALDIARKTPSKEELEAAVSRAGVIAVSGGNTVFAIERICATGLDALLRKAMERGVVLCGGSFGAICWFDAGHSDSMDPESFKNAMLAEAQQAATASAPQKDESSAAPQSAEEAKEWKYIRAPCLGFLPGLCCPHYDKVQSNGVLRATDFDAMMLRHPGERGICIDHSAALVVKGDTYEVLSLENAGGGSVSASGEFCSDRSGTPGMWQIDVVDGKTQRTLVPKSGLLSELLKPATAIVEDPLVAVCRAENPSAVE